LTRQHGHKIMNNEITEILARLLETVEQAIMVGDWKVDGRCDPDMIMHKAESILIDNGYRRESVNGEDFFIKDEME